MVESSSEYERFTRVMKGLMAVPYKELQKSLKREKRQKERRKRATQPAFPAAKGSA